MALVVDQNHGFAPPFVKPRPPRCKLKLKSYSQLDYIMLEFNHFTNFHKSFSTPCLSISSSLDEDHIDTTSTPTIQIIGGHGAPGVRGLVVEVATAMASGVTPEPVSSGLGGAYFLRQGQNGLIIAVAKPIDEEPLAFNNPKGFAGRMLGQPGMKRSIRVGETGLRELAAYLLDHASFSGVPETALVKISHSAFHVNDSDSVSAPPCKTASLQRFIAHDSDAGDLGPSGFSVNSVHRIGILDLRLLNLDRHAGNILVKHGEESNGVGEVELVPIDHGFCLPESLDDPYFEWLHWPQASVPFSEFELDYISNLDPYKDAELLRTELPSLSESSIRVLILCTTFLKRGSASGIFLADMGEMMTREFNGAEEQYSALERLCVRAKAILRNGNISADENVSDTDQDEETYEMFTFDDDYEENNSYSVPISPSAHVRGNPLKIPRFSSLGSLNMLDDTITSPLGEKNNLQDEKDDEDDNSKVGNLIRSMSSAAANHSNECEEICFGEMSNEEFESFLLIFETLLPEVFEGIKSMSLSKQRLGSSCEF